ARITFRGNSVHPGTAKNKMVNAGKIAAEFISKIPKQQAPEHTEKYEGVYHLLDLNGDVEQTVVSYINRDFDQDNIEARKETMRQYTEEITGQYGEGSTQIERKHQYYNKREKIEPVKHIVDIAYGAMENAESTQLVKPVS